MYLYTNNVYGLIPKDQKLRKAPPLFFLNLSNFNIF